MNSNSAFLMPVFNLGRRFFVLTGCVVALLALIAVSLSPAFAAELPDDDEEEVLIRTTLMTFNDANMTGNYAVFYAKASKEFQEQTTIEKLSASFEPLRKKSLFFEDVIAAEYDSYEKARFDADGILVLAGSYKTDKVEVKFRLRFVKNSKNDNQYKMLGINVNVKEM